MQSIYTRSRSSSTSGHIHTHTDFTEAGHSTHTLPGYNLTSDIKMVILGIRIMTAITQRQSRIN